MVEVNLAGMEPNVVGIERIAERRTRSSGGRTRIAAGVEPIVAGLVPIAAGIEGIVERRTRFSTGRTRILAGLGRIGVSGGDQELFDKYRGRTEGLDSRRRSASGGWFLERLDPLSVRPADTRLVKNLPLLEEPRVFVVRSDPAPENSVGDILVESTVASADPDRPIRSNPLEPERWMSGVVFEQLVVLPGKALNLCGKAREKLPERRAREMPQSSWLLPA